MTKTQLLDQYRYIRSAMEALRPSPKAELQYHCLADALYWTDEIPDDIYGLSESSLRPVLRYRTTLMLGAPEGKWQDYWTEATRQFPKWIGFSNARCSPNAALAKRLMEFQAESGID